MEFLLFRLKQHNSFQIQCRHFGKRETPGAIKCGLHFMPTEDKLRIMQNLRTFACFSAIKDPETKTRVSRREKAKPEPKSKIPQPRNSSSMTKL